MKTTDTVSIQIPIKPEFVSIARLTASGVAHRSGFDIDTIEDIKVALSEVLAKIIEKRTSSGRVSMDFLCTEQGLSININYLMIVCRLYFLMRKINWHCQLSAPLWIVFR